MNETAVRAVVAGVVAAMVLASVVAQAAGQSNTEPAFVVDLASDGDATVTIVYTFDLGDDNETDAFEQLRDDAAATERLVTTFEDRMAAVAANTENRTGRETAAGNATATFETVDRTGVVRLSLAWDGLAAVEGDRLTVTEPFASGFQPDRQFRVLAPDGYVVASTTPDPSSAGDGRATWDANSDLSGFEVVVAPDSETGDADTTTSETSTAGPGFGVAVTIAAAALCVAVLSQRL